MASTKSPVWVVGGGLAGCEAALWLADRGIFVNLFEMRPQKMTAAHQAGALAELVCSNSLGSDQPGSAPHLLKQELRSAGCRLLAIADETKVDAGKALALDRERFAQAVTTAVSTHPHIRLLREEVCEIPLETHAILASGPLTSGALAEFLKRLLGETAFFFFDAISPIVYDDSIDKTQTFAADRYQESKSYLNCPLNREQYAHFIAELLAADQYPIHDFERDKIFAACQPIELLAQSGKDTLRFGPMKPVGLRDPESGRRPFAVVQLRRENHHASLWNLVGFQSKLRKREQQRVFGLIPALQQARYARYGSMHRNSYIFSPGHIRDDLSFKAQPNLFIAGQLSGVEGYTESIAIGHLAARNLERRLSAKPALKLPANTAIGALFKHLTAAVAKPAAFQPFNINFGIIEDYHAPRANKAQYRLDFSQACLERFKQALVV